MNKYDDLKLKFDVGEEVYYLEDFVEDNINFTLIKKAKIIGIYADTRYWYNLQDETGKIFDETAIFKTLKEVCEYYGNRETPIISHPQTFTCYIKTGNKNLNKINETIDKCSKNLTTLIKTLKENIFKMKDKL